MKAKSWEKKLRLFPYFRGDDPDYAGEDWMTAAEFPSEVFARDGSPRFLIHGDCVETEGSETAYQVPCEITEDGARHPCVDFLEIECVAVAEYSTVWQFTGTIYSNRTDFDPEDYVGAVDLTDAELQYFRDTCEEAYTIQRQTFGDPRWEDRRGDCDGKAAYVTLDLSVVSPYTAGFYSTANTDLAGLDCLVMGANFLPERRTNLAWKEAEDSFAATLIHELNHYIVNGCIGHESERWNMWTGEAFAQAAIDTVKPESVAFLEFRSIITDNSSRLRLIPGMLWSYDDSSEYPVFNQMPYTLGQYFLRYIERETTGKTDGRLWTEYFSQRTPEGSITGTELDGYLTVTTGEGLDPWMARFMAAAVVGADSGPYCMGKETITAEYRVDPYVFFRPYEEFGANLSFDGAADEAVKEFFQQDYDFSALEGGGTTYAWRNDAGGRIAITDADDRWYFFAVTMVLPGEREVIDIDSPEELAKIGRDPGYLLSGRYRLTADLDLGGASNPWSPIGKDKEPFTGEFDGNGHVIRGLYVNNAKTEDQGLFCRISGNSEIRDLTVYGSVTGRNYVGGIIGFIYGGTVRGCKSFVTVAGKRHCGGIAGYLNAGAIEDCTAAGTVTGSEFAGGIAGFNAKGAVEDCTATGTVTGNTYVGGIAGYHYLGTIQDCTAAGTVTGSEYIAGITGYGSWAAIKGCGSTATVTGVDSVGGVAGCDDGCIVSECNQSGSVTGERCVGGIVGLVYQYGTIRNCYQTGTVDGAERVGGVVGQIQKESILQNCYNAGTVSGESYTGGITGRAAYAAAENCYSYQPAIPAVGNIYSDENGDTATVTSCYSRSDTETGQGLLTTAAFGDPASFAGWDFDAVWSLDNGVRPVLRDNMENVKPAPKPRGGGGGAAAAVNPVNLVSSGVAANGAVKVDKTNAKAGETVTITVEPEAGYQTAGVTVTDAKGNNVPVTKNADGTYSFTMPATAVTITPKFEKAGEAPASGDVSDRFVDVSRDAWYHDAVQWAVDKGLMNGVSDTLFAPNDNTTRAMVVTMLWRLADEPAVSAESGFTDVSSDAWYAQAVAWAAETGAVNGTSADTFSPNTPVTREQLAAILYRYAQAQGKGFTGAWMFLLDYPDRDQVSEYAYEPLCWMTMNGIITGMDDGALAPKDNATRTQIATMFQRFCVELGETVSP